MPLERQADGKHPTASAQNLISRQSSLHAQIEGLEFLDTQTVDVVEGPASHVPGDGAERELDRRQP